MRAAATTSGAGQADIPGAAIPAARRRARHVRARDARVAEREDLGAAAAPDAVRCAYRDPGQLVRRPARRRRHRCWRRAPDGRCRATHRSRCGAHARWEDEGQGARPAMAQALTTIRPSSRSTIPSSSRASLARSAKCEVRSAKWARSTTRRRGPSSRWSARRRWRPRSTSCSACAADCATRSSPPRCLRPWPRYPSTTRAARACWPCFVMERGSRSTASRACRRVCTWRCPTPRSGTSSPRRPRRRVRSSMNWSVRPRRRRCCTTTTRP